MVYIFFFFFINVYIYTVSSVSKGVKRQCRIYVQPAGQTVSNLFGICGLNNSSADVRQLDRCYTEKSHLFEICLASVD